MYCARTARQATPPECHETIARTTDSALYSTCRACAWGQRLMATITQWGRVGGADASPPLFNDTEETMTKAQKTAKKTTPTTAAAPATAPTLETTAQTPAPEDRAGTPAPAGAKTYTINDVCERIGLPYGTVYAAVRHLKRGKPATSPSQQTVKEALKTMCIGATDLVAAPKGKKPKDSPLDELAAAQTLAAAVAPASPQEAGNETSAFATLFSSPFTKSTVQVLPAPASENDVSSVDPQPDEGDLGAYSGGGVPGDSPIDREQSYLCQRCQWQTTEKCNDCLYGEMFEAKEATPQPGDLDQAVIHGINTLHRALSLHELPLEDLLTELQRRMPQAEVVVRIGPAAA